MSRQQRNRIPRLKRPRKGLTVIHAAAFSWCLDYDNPPNRRRCLPAELPL
jgi:hypothetical protein